MRIPEIIRTLLYRLGWDSCDTCGFRITRKDGWHGKGWDLWGPWLYCPDCNAALNVVYDEQMSKEIQKTRPR